MNALTVRIVNRNKDNTVTLTEVGVEVGVPVGVDVGVCTQIKRRIMNKVNQYEYIDSQNPQQSQERLHCNTHRGRCRSWHSCGHSRRILDKE